MGWSRRYRRPTCPFSFCLSSYRRYRLQGACNWLWPRHRRPEEARRRSRQERLQPPELSREPAEQWVCRREAPFEPALSMRAARWGSCLAGLIEEWIEPIPLLRRLTLTQPASLPSKNWKWSS